MTEVLVAVYNTASAAEIAMDDLAVARVPTAAMRRFVSDPAVLTVIVDERHTREVVEILAMQAPATMAEAPLRVA